MPDPLIKMFLYPFTVTVRHRKGLYHMVQKVIDWTDERVQRHLGRRLDKLGEGIIATKQRLQLADEHAFKPLEEEFPNDPVIKSIRTWFEIVYEDLDGMRDETILPILNDDEDAVA